MQDVCRLCSNTEHVIDMFHTKLDNSSQLRVYILLATGIQIKETDAVSKMVCQRCCEIAVKLHKYRTNAVANDKLLKERCNQPYEPPITNQIELYYTANQMLVDNVTNVNEHIKQEENEETQTISDDSWETVISPRPRNNVLREYKHPSILKLYKKYKGIRLPREIFTSDVNPVITIDQRDIRRWYTKQLHKYRQKLRNVVIKSVSGSLNLKVPLAESTINKSHVTDSHSSNCSSEEVVDEVNAKQPLVNSSRSSAMKRTQQKENSDDVNQVIDVNDEAHTTPRPRARKRTTQVVKKPLERNSTTETIPAKKKRRYSETRSASTIKKINKVELPNHSPKNKQEAKSIFTSSLELTPVPLNTRSTEMTLSQATTSLPNPVTPNTKYIVQETKGAASDSKAEPTPVELQPKPAESKLAKTGPKSVEQSKSNSPESKSAESVPDLDHENAMMSAEKTLIVFVCSVCNKLYYSKRGLQDHERIHLICKFCKQKFTNIESLKQHQGETCFINIVKRPPIIKLKRVDENLSIVQKYAQAFGKVHKSPDKSDGVTDINAPETTANSTTCEFSQNVTANTDAKLENVSNSNPETTDALILMQKIITNAVLSTMNNNTNETTENDIDVTVVSTESAIEKKLAHCEIVDLSTGTKISTMHTEVVCISDESEDEVQITATTPPSEANKANLSIQLLKKQSRKATSTKVEEPVQQLETVKTQKMPEAFISEFVYQNVDEKDMPHCLFKKYGLERKENATHTFVPTINSIKYVDDLIIIENMYNELYYNKVPITLESNPSITVSFKEEQKPKAACNFECWVHKKVIDIQEPSQSVQQPTPEPTNNNPVILLNKQNKTVPIVYSARRKNGESSTNTKSAPVLLNAIPVVLNRKSLNQISTNVNSLTNSTASITATYTDAPINMSTTDATNNFSVTSIATYTNNSNHTYSTAPVNSYVNLGINNLNILASSNANLSARTNTDGTTILNGLSGTRYSLKSASTTTAKTEARKFSIARDKTIVVTHNNNQTNVNGVFYRPNPAVRVNYVQNAPQIQVPNQFQQPSGQISYASTSTTKMPPAIVNFNAPSTSENQSVPPNTQSRGTIRIKSVWELN